MVKKAKNQLGNAISGAAAEITRRADDIDSLEVVLHETSVRDVKLQRCLAILTGWVNSVVEPSRMVVQDFFDDLYDAKILIKVIEMKTGDVLPASLSALTYRAILENVKSLTNYMINDLGIEPNEYWRPELVASKQVHAILFLVKDLAYHFEMVDPMPGNVQIVCIHKEKKGQHIERKVMKHPFTDEEVQLADVVRIRGGSDDEEALVGDVFDKLLVASEDKVDKVKQLLLQFVNKHLATSTGNGRSVNQFGSEFSDGTLFIHLLGILGEFYIAQNEYYTDVTTELQSSHNLKVVMAILLQQGVEIGGLKKQAIMDGEEGAVMRTAYRIYQKFKHLA